MKKHIDEQPENVVELLKDLAKFANYYEKLLFPEKETHQKIREALFRLNQIELTIAYPFLLNIIVQLVEQMLELNKQLASANEPQIKKILKRQIEVVDGEIDQLVYRLYDLTVEEIGIVEKGE